MAKRNRNHGDFSVSSFHVICICVLLFTAIVIAPNFVRDFGSPTKVVTLTLPVEASQSSDIGNFGEGFAKTANSPMPLLFKAVKFSKKEDENRTKNSQDVGVKAETSAEQETPSSTVDDILIALSTPIPEHAVAPLAHETILEATDILDSESVVEHVTEKTIEDSVEVSDKKSESVAETTVIKPIVSSEILIDKSSVEIVDEVFNAGPINLVEPLGAGTAKVTVPNKIPDQTTVKVSLAETLPAFTASKPISTEQTKIQDLAVLAAKIRGDNSDQKLLNNLSYTFNRQLFRESTPIAVDLVSKGEIPGAKLQNTEMLINTSFAKSTLTFELDDIKIDSEFRKNSLLTQVEDLALVANYLNNDVNDVGTPTLTASIDAITENQTIYTVQKGDVLSTIFTKLGFLPSIADKVINSGKKTKQLKWIKPGQVFTFKQNQQGEFVSIGTELLNSETLIVIRDKDDSYRTNIIPPNIEKKIHYASAIIDSSLFNSAKRVGVSDSVILQIMDIFRWDIDFASDVRAGDEFSVVYEQVFRDGVKVSDGKVLAAEFVNKNQPLRAIRFAGPDNSSAYYAPDGMSMRKAFIRTPVKFTRITSRFTRARMHPTLHRIRAHKGVDYAAPRGTPVKAAGDGKIVFSGWKKGYGRTVVIKHGSKYSTLYAHLSRIPKRAKSGSRIKQGKVIGYVGSSGFATGPHLHYEFRVNGLHKDPLRVKLPKALPIDKKYRKLFEEQSSNMLAALEKARRTAVAKLEE